MHVNKEGQKNNKCYRALPSKVMFETIYKGIKHSMQTKRFLKVMWYPGNAN